MGWESDVELRRIANALESIAKSLAREAIPGPPLQTIASSLAQFVKDYEAAIAAEQAPPFIHPVITITGGKTMPSTLTVDETGNATLGFVDDKGDTDAKAPVAASGAALVVTFASDNTSVANVAASSDPLVGIVDPIGEGTANISAVLSYADGTPVLEADGTTPLPDPQPANVTIVAGGATGTTLSIATTTNVTPPAPPA